MSRSRLSDDEFNLVLELTRRTKMDTGFDIASDTTHDYFIDFEDDEKHMTLKEGFELIASGIAYSFQHEGFSDDEAKILENCIKRYVPSFKALDPSKD